MKKIFSALLLSLLSFATSFSQKVNVGDLWYSLDNENMTAEVKMSFNYWNQENENYSYIQGDVVIPSTITYDDASYTVTGIGGSAFCNAKGIKSVSLPSTIKYIDFLAFEKCGLKTVYIPSSVDSIATTAFYHCDSLENVYIENLKSWCEIVFFPSYVEPDADPMFQFYNPLQYASNLYVDGVKTTDLYFPDSIKSIKNNAFVNFRGLHSISIASEKMQIGKNAFYGCRNLESVIFPEHISKISDKAFFGCTSLATVDIPIVDGEYEMELFSGCSNLRDVKIPGEVSKLGVGMFQNCSNLEEIVLPCSLTLIGSRSFMGCSSLKSITFPDRLQTIGALAFSGCVSLEKMVLPKNLQIIGGQAFENCCRLESIVFPDGFQEYHSKAFQGCHNLKSITIPASVTGFGQWAFEDCPSFDEVHVNDLNKWMGLCFWGNTENPLYYAHNLYLNDKLVTDIVVPKEVEGIGSFTFCGCRSLDTVTINQYVSIQKDAFYDCGCEIYIYGKAHFDVRSLMGSKEHKNTVWTWRGYVSQMEYEIEQSSNPLIYYERFNHLYMFDTPIYTTGPTTIRLDSIDIKYCDIKINDYWVENNSYQDRRVSTTCSPGQENVLRYYFRDPNGEMISGSYVVTIPPLEFQKTKVTMVEKDVVLAETPSNIWEEQSNRNIQHEIVTVDSDDYSRLITAGKICDGFILARTKLYYGMNQQLLKIRPYYTDQNGNNYYGEWVEFDPTQYQYIVDATVYTSPNFVTDISQVSLKGYCFAGTIPITEYGFMLTEVATGNVAYYPFNGDGIYQNIMNMTIESLNEGKYHYCAYAKTKDDIVFGETYDFHIKETTHIPAFSETSNPSSALSPGIYTIQGVKIANHWEQLLNLPPGIYIVNGKKMVVK